jgi:cytochrome c biogenesis protein CcdA
MWTALYLTGVLASLVASVYYSVTARRRDMHPLAARMTLGKMNVAMGILLLFFGTNQFTYEPLTTTRVVVAVVFLLLGGVNAVLGTRNFLAWRKEWREAVKQEN